MNGQYLCNRQITVSYAYKKDTKGERHGTPAGTFSHFSPHLILPSSPISITTIDLVFRLNLFPCNTERVLAASNPSSQKSRPHTLFASGPPTLPSGPQANGGIGAPVPPRPFPNGTVPPGPMPVARPPPPQNVPYPQMQLAGQSPWQGQPQHLGQQIPPPVMPPPPMQYRPPPPNMPPPPPPQSVSGLSRPPPPMGMGAPHGWPQQQMGGRPPMPQMSMPPPPPPPSTS